MRQQYAKNNVKKCAKLSINHYFGLYKIVLSLLFGVEAQYTLKINRVAISKSLSLLAKGSKCNAT